MVGGMQRTIIRLHRRRHEKRRQGTRRSAAAPEHLATRRREPRSLSLIVMKSFKPSGLNEPVKRHSALHFCLEIGRHRLCAAGTNTHGGENRCVRVRKLTGCRKCINYVYLCVFFKTAVFVMNTTGFNMRVVIPGFYEVNLYHQTNGFIIFEPWI